MVCLSKALFDNILVTIENGGRRLPVTAQLSYTREQAEAIQRLKHAKDDYQRLGLPYDATRCVVVNVNNNNNNNNNKLCARPPQYAPPPATLTFNLLILKVVFESRVTWATSMGGAMVLKVGGHRDQKKFFDPHFLASGGEQNIA